MLHGLCMGQFGVLFLLSAGPKSTGNCSAGAALSLARWQCVGSFQLAHNILDICAYPPPATDRRGARCADPCHASAKTGRKGQVAIRRENFKRCAQVPPSPSFAHACPGAQHKVEVAKADAPRRSAAPHACRNNPATPNAHWAGGERWRSWRMRACAQPCRACCAESKTQPASTLAPGACCAKRRPANHDWL